MADDDADVGPVAVGDVAPEALGDVVVPVGVAALLLTGLVAFDGVISEP